MLKASADLRLRATVLLRRDQPQFESWRPYPNQITRLQYGPTVTTMPIQKGAIATMVGKTALTVSSAYNAMAALSTTPSQ